VEKEKTINKEVIGKHGKKCRITCKMKVREPESKDGMDMDMQCDMEGDCQGIAPPMGSQ
jgi:hypothetical protein